jgi:pyruvate dehydrogenase E2 component (dihydrolipoamide acetyltransferase)
MSLVPTMSMEVLLKSLPPWPNQDFSAYGETEIKKLPRIQVLTAAFLSRNWVAIPHVTHHDEVDVTEMEAWRGAWNAKTQGPRLTPLIPVIKAVIAALKLFPQFNASVDVEGGRLILKKYFHIGIAAETPAGLLVPVVRDCDRKSVSEIAAEIAATAEKARTRGLSMAEMSGGCFSISSLGHIGGTAFTPIINAPEVAILGMTKIQLRAVQDDEGGIAWRKLLPLSLSYDHRVINGADAARFTRYLGDMLAAPESLMP